MVELLEERLKRAMKRVSVQEGYVITLEPETG